MTRPQPDALGAFMELAPDALVVIDGTGGIVLVNAQTETMFGYERGALIGRPVEVLLPERFRGAHVTRREAYGRDPKARPMGAGLDLFGRRRDGSEFPVDISLSSLQMPDGVLFVAAVRDMSERRRIEDARATLAAIVESSDEAIIGKTLDGVITTWNRAAERLYGYPAAEAIGRPISMLIPESRAGDERGILDRVAHGEVVDHYETERVRKDGSVFRASVTISPIRDASGRVFGASVIARDVTERARAEAALRASEQRFRAFLEFAPDAVVAVDPSGEIVLVNAQAEKMFCATRDELIGRSVETLIPERFRGAHLQLRREFARNPRTRPMEQGLELFGVRSDGREFPADISLSPLPTPEGMLLVAAIRDVTERRRLERLRDEFIRDAAHELRTPLTTLAGVGQLLATRMDRMSPEQLSESLAALARQGERASALVSNLLDLTQIEAGRMTLDLRPVDVEESVRVALDAVPPPEDRSVDMAFDGRLLVRADPARLEQIVTNLLVNAYRYGGARIRVAATAEDGAVLLSVADDGPGVSDDLLPRLFHPFTRGKSAGARSGSGVGLALARRLAEAFGGTIWYEAAVPHGARFVTRLPRA